MDANNIKMRMRSTYISTACIASHGGWLQKDGKAVVCEFGEECFSTDAVRVFAHATQRNAYGGILYMYKLCR